MQQRFLGFEMVTASLPPNASETVYPKTEITFRQHANAYTVPVNIKVKDSNNNPLRETVQTHSDVSAAIPYTSLNTGTSLTIHETGGSRQIDVTRLYDSGGLGNIVELRRHGNVAGGSPADEVTAAVDYVPNNGAYIISLPNYGDSALIPAEWLRAHLSYAGARAGGSVTNLMGSERT